MTIAQWEKQNGKKFSYQDKPLKSKYTHWIILHRSLEVMSGVLI